MIVDSRMKKKTPLSFKFQQQTLVYIDFSKVNKAVKMRRVTLIMSLFFTVLSALVLPQRLDPNTDYCAGNKQTVGHCETLSYVDTTASASNPPSVKECQEACWSTFMDAGDWSVALAGSQTPPLFLFVDNMFMTTI